MKRVRNIFIIIIILGIGVWIFVPKQKEYASTANGWNLVLVNEEYYVPKEYEIELVTLDNGEKVDKRIYVELVDMFDAAREDDVYMYVADGYRSEEEQMKIMLDKKRTYQERVLLPFIAEYMAKQWVAVPGTSEHQLGLAVDINADIAKSSSAEVYEWLAQNAHEYGFIKRYPEDKTEITGISHEPWHYRYVGLDYAEEIYESKLCLEEYLEMR